MLYSNSNKSESSYDLNSLLNKNNRELDYIFKDTDKYLDELTVVQAERQVALNNLRLLTKRLQANRLKQKAKAFCKYFSD